MANAAKTLLPVATTAVGFLTGGPAGAAIGAGLGFAGSTLLNKPPAPPPVAAPIAQPTPDQIKNSQQQSLAALYANRGRASTILTNSPDQQKLGS